MLLSSKSDVLRLGPDDPAVMAVEQAVMDRLTPAPKVVAQPPRVLLCSCGEPAEDVCTWMVRRYVPVFAEHLERGDLLCRFNQDGPRVGRARITSIEWTDPLAVYQKLPAGMRTVRNAFVTLEIRYSTGTVKASSFNINEGARVKALRLVECHAGVCSLCGRDPADGHRVCDDHRNAWEKVA